MPNNKLDRTIAPLMRFLRGTNAHVLRFEILTEELMLALLDEKQDRISRLREQMKDELEKRLPRELPEVQKQKKLLDEISGTDFWTHLDLERILNIQKEIAPLMRYRLAEPRNIVKLNLPDQIQVRRWITYGPAGEGAFVDQYRAQVEAHVKILAEQESIFGKIKRRQRLADDELTALIELLNKPDLFIREETLQNVYEHPEMGLLDFIPLILDDKTSQIPSRAELIKADVEQFLEQRPRLTQAQRQFIYVLRSLLIQQAHSGTRTPLSQERLTRAPFKRVGQPKNLFSAQELDELLLFANYQISQIVGDSEGQDKRQA
jgi:type I restriction enzyme R subunit